MKQMRDAMAQRQGLVTSGRKVPGSNPTLATIYGYLTSPSLAAQSALEFCPMHCPNGRLGQDLGFGGFAFALKLPELLNTNLAAVRAKLGQTSCFPNGPQIWCPINMNMAATRELVASELLCYILNKFGRVAEDKIKLIILDFYTTEEISEGKILLNKHLVQVKLEELPRLKKRLGDNRNGKDLDDIFEMVNLADEKLMLNDLPSFVAVNLERVPLLRPEDLDLVVLSKKVSAIEDRLKLLSDAGSVLEGRCDNSGSKCRSVSSQVNKTDQKLLQPPPAVKLFSEVVAPQHNVADDSGDAFIPVTRKKPKGKKPSRPIVGNFNASLTKLSPAKPVLHKSIFHVDNAA